MNVDGAFVANDETLPTSEYVIGRLNDYKLSHLLLMGATTDFSGTSLAALAADGMFRHFRALYRGPLIANTGIDRERGNRLIEDGLATWWHSAAHTSPTSTCRSASPAKRRWPNSIGIQSMPPVPQATPTIRRSKRSPVERHQPITQNAI
jgi:hypothetical protein